MAARFSAGFFAAYALLLVLVALPLARAPLLPLLDWPQHLYVTRVLADLGRAELPFGAHFKLNPQLAPYATFAWAGAALARVLPLETAARVLLGLYFAGVPLALGDLRRSYGRSPWIALLAFPILYCSALYDGYVPYLVSLPLAFAALAQVRRACAALTPGRWCAVVGLSCLLFLTHAGGFALWAVLSAPAYLWAAWRTPRRAAALATTILPVALLVGAWLGGLRSHPPIEAIGLARTADLAAKQLPGPPARPVSAVAATFVRDLCDGPTRDDGRDVALAWLALAAAVGAAGALGGGRVHGWRRALAGGAPALVPFGLLALIYVATYRLAVGPYVMGPRLAGAVALALVAALPDVRRTPRLVPLGLGGALLALTLHTSVLNQRAFDRFAVEARDFEVVLARIPPGRRVYPLIFTPASQVIRGQPYAHFGAYVSVRRDGICGVMLALSHYAMPVWPRHRALLPGPEDHWMPGDFRHDLHGRDYDYLLVRDARRLRRRVQATPDELEQVAALGEWSLYRPRRPSRWRPIASLHDDPRARVTDHAGGTVTQCGLTPAWSWECPGVRVVPSLQVAGLSATGLCVSAPAGHEVRLAFAVPREARAVRAFGDPAAGTPLGLTLAVDAGAPAPLVAGAGDYGVFESALAPSAREVVVRVPGPATGTCFSAAWLGSVGEDAAPVK